MSKKGIKRKERGKRKRKTERRPQKTNTRGAWMRVKVEIKEKEVGRKRS